MLSIAVVAGSKSLTSMEASAALLGCARLGFHSGPEVNATCWEAMLHAGARDIQGVANSALALVVLEVLWRPIVTLLEPAE